MTQFKPLRGWRYNLDKIEFSDVLAPPYDVISSQGQDRLYQRSDFNCIRLILNRITEGDNAENNRYTRARDFFNHWREESVLVQEKEPAFYHIKIYGFHFWFIGSRSNTNYFEIPGCNQQSYAVEMLSIRPGCLANSRLPLR